MLDTSPTALLTIRAWCEEGSSHPLRVEIRVAKDVTSGFGPTVAVARAEAVVDAVRAFLDDAACSTTE